MRLTETAHAKLNLALHIRARRADGYHMLETLFAFCADGDVLSAEPSDGLSLHIEGPFAQGLSTGADNLVMRAAKGLQSLAGVKAGAALHLEKCLPVASGIGGGSADAAAAIRLLCRLWSIDPGEDALFDLAASLGADVPACLRSGTCFGTGTGTDLAPLDLPGLGGLPALLVNPGAPCATGPVFKAWDGVDRGPLDPRAWEAARNDLEVPALGLVPEIGDVLQALGPGARLARMSGSGATCFALYGSAAERDAALAAVRQRHPDWWCLATALR